MKCRSCKKSYEKIVLDLGCHPPSNNYLNHKSEISKEIKKPLQLFFCDECFLLQTNDFFEPIELFSEKYAYLSSVSKTWVNHTEKLKEFLVNEYNVKKDDFIVEIASNDGCLLNQFIKSGYTNCLGVEPTEIAANLAINSGIKVVKDFFNLNTSKNIIKNFSKAKLIIANNVIAHVDDLNDFVKSLKLLLDEEGIISIEFAHLLELIKYRQFDTIYHEHFSYLSLIAINEIFKNHKLKIFDIKSIKTHGGSLRVLACHLDNKIKITNRFHDLIKLEENYQLNKRDVYEKFCLDVENIKEEFLKFLRNAKVNNKIIVAYGAAAKGNTFLNFCKINKKDILFVVDNAFTKQGKFLPGSHIPIVKKSKIKEIKPDYILILPWNIYDEIVEDLIFCREWGCKFVRSIPKLEVSS